MSNSSHSQALKSLVSHVEATNKTVHIGWDEVVLWHEGVLALFVGVGLLVASNHTQSLECHGCEHRCFRGVELTGDKQRAFIVCDHMDMQSQMGRISIPLQRLQQWQASPRQFAVVIANLLGFEGAQQSVKGAASYKLGMLKSNGGRRWVSLAVNPLTIVINQHATPVGDLLYVENNTLGVDRERIEELLNAPTKNDKAYTPSTDRLDARRQATQAMHQDWKDAYLAALKKYPKKSAGWHSRQIAKLPMANGRSPETIRKNMKS